MISIHNWKWNVLLLLLLPFVVSCNFYHNCRPHSALCSSRRRRRRRGGEGTNTDIMTSGSDKRNATGAVITTICWLVFGQQKQQQQQRPRIVFIVMLEWCNWKTEEHREREGKGGEEEQAKGRRDEEIVTHAHPKQFTVAFTFTRRQNVAPFQHSSVAQGEGTVATTDIEREGDREEDCETDWQRAGKEAKQNMLVTLHFDALNACCASKLIAAACCSAPKFNAKFNKYNNGAPISECPKPSPPFPSQPQKIFKIKNSFSTCSSDLNCDSFFNSFPYYFFSSFFSPLPLFFFLLLCILLRLRLRLISRVRAQAPELVAVSVVCFGCAVWHVGYARHMPHYQQLHIVAHFTVNFLLVFHVLFCPFAVVAALVAAVAAATCRHFVVCEICPTVCHVAPRGCCCLPHSVVATFFSDP